MSAYADLFARQRARLADGTPGRRAGIDQTAARVRDRFDQAGIELTHDTLSAFTAGVMGLVVLYAVPPASPAGYIAGALVDAAAQLDSEVSA